MAPLATGQTFKHINANAAATNIKSGPGTLLAVIINTKGASSNVLTLYDDSGTGTTRPIAVIDTTSGPVSLLYMLDFPNGLAYALATGTAADVTLVFI